jgi:hypothetical protein
VPVDAPREQRGNDWGNADPVEAVLAKALGEAAAAGRFDVVGQLARELEARRTRVGANVIALDARRKK